jgi:DNA repair protein RadC
MPDCFEESPLFELVQLERRAFVRPPEPDRPTPHYYGHRERLRERFREGGADAMPDYEILEMLLFRVIPRRDTKPLANALIRHFGSLGAVISASPQRLAEVDGVGEAIITDLKLVQAAALRLLKAEVKQRDALHSWSQVLDYLRASMAFETREQFRVIYLDKRNRVITDEVHARGTVDHTPVYVREIIKRALEVAASAIIIAHNHPSGDPTPSQTDIDMTKKVVAAGERIGIAVHDHVIIGRDGVGYLSFRQAELL